MILFCPTISTRSFPSLHSRRFVFRESSSVTRAVPWKSERCSAAKPNPRSPNGSLRFVSQPVRSLSQVRHSSLCRMSNPFVECRIVLGNRGWRTSVIDPRCLSIPKRIVYVYSSRSIRDSSSVFGVLSFVDSCCPCLRSFVERGMSVPIVFR